MCIFPFARRGNKSQIKYKTDQWLAVNISSLNCSIYKSDLSSNHKNDCFNKTNKALRFNYWWECSFTTILSNICFNTDKINSVTFLKKYLKIDEKPFWTQFFHIQSHIEILKFEFKTNLTRISSSKTNIIVRMIFFLNRTINFRFSNYCNWLTWSQMH